MNPDPLSELGLTPGASAADIRRARRDLARDVHPDAGGDEATMQRVNAAAAAALRQLDAGGAERYGSDPNASSTSPAWRSEPSHRGASTADIDDIDDIDARWTGPQRDIPSFTVEALPAETFEALLVAANELGEVADDEPPYELHVLMASPAPCWCRLDVVPDAGSSTVSVTIAAADGAPVPRIERIRDAWIVALNRLDWDALDRDELDRDELDGRDRDRF